MTWKALITFAIASAGVFTSAFIFDKTAESEHEQAQNAVIKSKADKADIADVLIEIRSLRADFNAIMLKLIADFNEAMIKMIADADIEEQAIGQVQRQDVQVFDSFGFLVNEQLKRNAALKEKSNGGLHGTGTDCSASDGPEGGGGSIPGGP